jgi:hypothetical protein
VLYSEYKQDKYLKEHKAKIDKCLEELRHICEKYEIPEMYEISMSDHIKAVGSMTTMVYFNPNDFIDQIMILQWLDLVGNSPTATLEPNSRYKLDFDINEICVVSGTPVQKMVGGKWANDLRPRLVIYIPRKDDSK